MQRSVEADKRWTNGPKVRHGSTSSFPTHGFVQTQARRHTPNAPSPPRPGSLAPVCTGEVGEEGWGQIIRVYPSPSSPVAAWLLLVPSFSRLPVSGGGSKAVPSAQLLCATYSGSRIALGKFAVVNTGHYSSRFSLRDVSMAWTASRKCREL